MTQNQENTPSLKHPNKRLDLIAYLEEMLLMNEKSQDFDIDNIYHFFFDDTDLHPKAEAEIGWFLRNSDEAKVINELTFKLDELLKTLGDVTTQKFTNDCGWHDVVEKTKDALKLIAERDKGQIRCRAR